MLRPSRQWLPFVATAIFLVGCMRLINPTIDVGQSRPISFDQLTSNVMSVVSSDGGTPGAGASNGQLQGTKSWRLDWWEKIIDDTVRGPDFWTGKGFGVNLATAYDVPRPDDSLRSPHNGHMTILARMGVPGLVLWILIQATFAVSLLRAFFQARGKDDHFWMQINGWVLVYWVAMMVNMSFDVYLEGPQGGIWFWSIFGIGLAALAAQRTRSGHAVDQAAT